MVLFLFDKAIHMLTSEVGMLKERVCAVITTTYLFSALHTRRTSQYATYTPDLTRKHDRTAARLKPRSHHTGGCSAKTSSFASCRAFAFR